MDEKNVESLVAHLFKMPVECITDVLSMKDVETWDSLKHMELIVCIEQTFCVELTFDEIVKMQNVGEIKRILNERGVNGKHDTDR